MELTKDTYLYLANFADDRTILNMLSVNKKFNDPIFFQQVMERKYPLLIGFKNPVQNWKDFFLTMIKCIYIIEENHNIPYYPVEGYNPKDFCNRAKKWILNNIMSMAAEGGQIEIVKLMIEKGATDFDWAMGAAAYGGNMEIVKLMIEKGDNDFDLAMSYAARGGHIEIVKLMIEKGATDFDLAMAYAAKGGHIDIIKIMIDKGATDFDWTMRMAAEGGQMEIVEYLKSS